MMRVADSMGDRNATRNECYALSVLIVGPSRFYTDSLRDLTAKHDVAGNSSGCVPFDRPVCLGNGFGNGG